MPSTVVIDRPATAFAGVRQLTTGTPSSSTVQAPQTPAPQTSLVPVSARSSRSTSARSASGSSGKVAGRPLMVTLLMTSLTFECGISFGPELLPSSCDLGAAITAPVTISRTTRCRSSRKLILNCRSSKPLTAIWIARARSGAVMPSRSARPCARETRSMVSVCSLTFCSRKLWIRSRVCACRSDRSSPGCEVSSRHSTR